METAIESTPKHLWIVGGLATLWNGFGCYEYLMTRTQGAAYIKSMMPDVEAGAYMAYIDGFPLWASVGWALGVWGGLAGSILLLMRNRHAVLAYGLSLVGAVLGMGYQLMTPANVAGMDPTMSAIAPWLVIGIAVLLLLYARSMRAKSVLRQASNATG